ncbi:unnamed protein product [Echinostoma caproni]|uniref:Uncharacterized protein n=1 Tax=Echinostoma caproni TaxID=27848 RepID=A0A183A5F1_9TREM|nr:unnamed protein product [Echinostoma caproni]
MDYYRCVADPELGFLTGKDGTYGKYTMRLTASPTLTSRISSTPPATGPDGAADYTTRLWHPEHEMYHTCVPEHCRIAGGGGGSSCIVSGPGGISAPPTHTTLRRSPGGLELATVSANPQKPGSG